jgi:hypothetical protein
VSANNMIDYERIYENFSIRDHDSEYSLVNIVPEFLRQPILSIPEGLLELSERELTEVVNPDTALKKLRTSFWLEYVRAIRTDTTMLISNIHSGICMMAQFRKIVANNNKLVYIITPRPQYNVELEDLLFLGLERVRAALELDPVRKVRKKNKETDQWEDHIIVDTKLIEIQKKIFNELSDRRRGQLVQKVDINQKSLNYNVNTPAELPRSVAEIDAQLAALESNPPPALEAPIEEEAQPAKEEDPSVP